MRPQNFTGGSPPFLRRSTNILDRWSRVSSPVTIRVKKFLDSNRGVSKIRQFTDFSPWRRKGFLELGERWPLTRRGGCAELSVGWFPIQRLSLRAASSLDGRHWEPGLRIDGWCRVWWLPAGHNGWILAPFWIRRTLDAWQCYSWGMRSQTHF